MDRRLEWLMTTAAPIRPAEARALRRFGDLWRGGMPLTRAARQAGITIDEAQAALATWTVEPPSDTTSATLGRRFPTVEELRVLYLDEGLTAAQIGERLGLTVHQVRHQLERAGIRRPSASRAGEVVRLYQAGQSVRGVAATLGIHYRTVWRDLAAAGISRRPVGPQGQMLSRRALEQLYVRGGLSLDEVAKRFGVSRSVVVRNLDEHGLRRRQPVIVERTRLEDLYVGGGLGLRTVAARLGVTEGDIRRSLAHHGIPIRRPGRPATGQVSAAQRRDDLAGSLDENGR